MKLYLSSYRIPVPEKLIDLVGKPANEITVAVIPNAKDYYSARAKKFKVDDFCEFLKTLNMSSAVVDLQDYSDEKILEQELRKYDLIWAVGGNTFCLRYEMRRSGFENIIAGLLEDGMVFGGDSAGAIVAGRSLTGVELADEPEFAEVVINEGLRLVEFGIVPHADSQDYGQAIPEMRAAQEKEGETILLNDNQAIVIDESGRTYVEA